MFDDNEDEQFGRELSEDINAFNKMYDNDDYCYFDSDRIEAVIDHLLVSSQFKKARWAAEHALDHFPYNNLFLLRKAQAMSLSGELKGAIRILTQLERLEGKSLDLILTIASCFSQLRDADSAIKYFKKALEIAEEFERGEIYIDLAMEYENQNKYQEAISILKKALEEDPKNESVVYELAYCYDQIKEFNNAINCFLKYIDEDPYSYTAWYNLANAYARVKDFDQAIWAYEYCIIVNEDFSPAYFNLGNTYVEKKDYKTALDYYIKCLEIDGDDGMTYCSIGECHEELGELEAAYEAYVKSTDFLPQLADGWLGRGIINELRGNHSKAISELKVAVDLEPDNYTYHYALAGVYENNDQLDLAIECYEKAVSLDTSDDELIIDFLKCIFEIDPILMTERVVIDEDLKNNDAAMLTLVYAYWMQNRRTDALLIFDELLEINPSLAKSLFLHFPSMSGLTVFTDKIDE